MTTHSKSLEKFSNFGRVLTGKCLIQLLLLKCVMKKKTLTNENQQGIPTHIFGIHCDVDELDVYIKSYTVCRTMYNK